MRGDMVGYGGDIRWSRGARSSSSSNPGQGHLTGPLDQTGAILIMRFAQPRPVFTERRPPILEVARLRFLRIAIPVPCGILEELEPEFESKES